MEIQKFLESASLLISSDPLERIADNTKFLINKNNFIADIHCHFFDIRTINIKYFLLRLIKDKLCLRDEDTILVTKDPNIKYLNISYNTAYQNKLLSSKFDSDNNWSEFVLELEYLEKNESSFNTNNANTTRGIKDFIKNKKLLSLTTMSDVYDYYIQHYALNQYKFCDFYKKDLITIGLMMDLEMGWEVKIRKSIITQIEELKLLSNSKPVLPFLSVDPRRAHLQGTNNLYSLFMNAFDKKTNSFFGVKIYPGLGYFPSDYRLLPIYEICEKKNIPVIAHCGGETVTSHNINIEAYRMKDRVWVKGKNRQQVANQFNHPKEWIPVLQKYSKLKLCLGHFGGSDAWVNFHNTGSNDRISIILDLMYRYENVFADFSFNIIDSSLYSAYKSVLDLNERALHNSLFGSDFWVVCPSGDLYLKQLQFINKLEKHIEKLTCSNVKRFLFNQIG
jgi:predicted TIM-barrel fold metal-dependent hydrolase